MYVWSAAAESSSDDDPLVGSSAMRGHRERVTAIRWMPTEDTSIKHARLVTGKDLQNPVG